MPWFRLYRDLPSHPKIIRLSRKLKARGSPEPEAVALASFVLVLCTAASYATIDAIDAAADGYLPVRDYGELDEIIGHPGMTEDMLSVRLLDQTKDGRIYVHGFAERNGAVLRKLRHDHARDRANTKAAETPPRRHRDATETQATRGLLAGETIDGDGDGDGEEEEEKNSSAATPAATSDPAHTGSSLPCAPTHLVTSEVSGARADGSTPPAQTSLFDDDTTTAAETAPKRPRKPAKRADGTATDTRVKPIIEAWDRIYLARFGAPPMVRPNYAQVGKLVRRLDPSMTAEAVTELMDLGLRAASNDTDPFTQRQWSGLTLPDMLSAKRLTMAHALRKSRDEERWQRRHG